MWRALPLYPCRNEGEYRLPSEPSTKEPSGASLPNRKNVKRLTYEAAPNSDTVKKLCFQPAQAHSEPQAPLHAHHAERKTKTYVFEVD